MVEIFWQGGRPSLPTRSSLADLPISSAFRSAGRMKYSSSPVIELPVNGETLRFEQDNGSMQVGTSVWPCSLVLVKWLEHRLALGDTGLAVEGKAGVELGAGCGAAGLGLALLGLNATLTDIAPVMPALKRNVKRNVAATSLSSAGKPGCSAGKVKVAQLYWGNTRQVSTLKPPFDIIVATDVVYLENIVEPLLLTMDSLAGPSTLIFFSYQVRSPESHELFWKRCPDFFTVRKIPHSELHPDYAFEETDVYILKKK